ncbi:MAG: hypothetical protein Kow00121_63990 [Elainellaceae cyanobacterium]
MSNQLSTAERIESLKAGIAGAFATVSCFLLIVLSDRLMEAIFSAPALSASALSAPTVFVLNGTVLIRGAIALFSGFLFGVTYRYIIRQDANPHLRGGAVMAFGLVRGLAQVEAELMPSVAVWKAGILVVESILMFAIASVLLDWSMQQGWLKRFNA